MSPESITKQPELPTITKNFETLNAQIEALRTDDTAQLPEAELLKDALLTGKDPFNFTTSRNYEAAIITHLGEYWSLASYHYSEHTATRDPLDLGLGEMYVESFVQALGDARDRLNPNYQ